MDRVSVSARLRAIRDRGLPILLEEEFQYTVQFVREWAPACRILVPHVGNLNGGYIALKAVGVWALPNVFTDSSGGQGAEALSGNFLRFIAQQRP